MSDKIHFAGAGEPYKPSRETITRVLLGQEKPTPELLQFLFGGVDPSKLTVEPHPGEEVRQHLLAWWQIGVVKGKFSPNWRELWEACKQMGLAEGTTDCNQWLPVILDCMRQRFGGPITEDALIAHLYRQHRLAPAVAANLSLEQLAELLRGDCKGPAVDPAGTDRQPNQTPAPMPAA